MAQFSVSITIDAAGVKQINEAGQFVTIVKQVNRPGDDASRRSHSRAATEAALPVAWVAFAPKESNTITWAEQYYLYATDTILQAGAEIVQSSITDAPASDGNTYPFQDGAFGSPVGDQPAGTFGVNNQAQEQDLSFGLAQEVTLNGNPAGATPLNALRVLNNEVATFQPEETLSVFLSGYENNGVVIANVASTALVVTVPSGQTINLGFDDQTNTFIKA